MDLVYLIILLLGFGVVAYYDWKHKEIPDLLTAVLWFGVCVMPFPTINYYIAMFMFMFAFLSNTIVFHITKKAYLGWGDILLLPIYAIAITGVGGLLAWIIGTMGMVLAFVISRIKKQPVALAPNLFIFYAMAIFLR